MKAPHRITLMYKHAKKLCVVQGKRSLCSLPKLAQTQRKLEKPKASEVLTCYLNQCKEPPWTSYFVKYSDVKDDQWGKSHFNWKIGNSNYHILRAGCYPYIKYHCTKRKEQDLRLEDSLFRFIKVFNLGIPLLAYGIAATQLITHTEIVNMPLGPVKIYFLYEENKGSQY